MGRREGPTGGGNADRLDPAVLLAGLSSAPLDSSALNFVRISPTTCGPGSVVSAAVDRERPRRHVDPERLFPLLGSRVVSVPDVSLDAVEVTEVDISCIPVEHLRVSRAQFGAVWAAAERRNTDQGQLGITDWYAAPSW